MSDLQKLINKDLRERINMAIFKRKIITTKFKNTADRRCKKCGSDNIYVESRQTRSADETTTKIYECLNCGDRWSEY